MTKPPRHRVEVVMQLPDSGYVLELLLDPAYPESLGKVRHPGGKVEPGETVEEAAVREMHEEYGIILNAWSLIRGKTAYDPRGIITQLHTRATKAWIDLDTVEGNNSPSRLVFSEVLPEHPNRIWNS